MPSPRKKRATRPTCRKEKGSDPNQRGLSSLEGETQPKRRFLDIRKRISSFFSGWGRITFREEHCFLSEFDLPVIRKWVSSPVFPYMVAGVSLFWTLFVLVLGDWVGGNAMAILFKAEASMEDGGSPVTAILPLYFGHLSTANSAPFYLLVFPFLLILSIRFHTAAGSAFARLHQRGILKSDTPWHQVVAKRNRWCGTLPILLFPIILCKCLDTQLNSLAKGEAGLPPVPETFDSNAKLDYPVNYVGFVQSPNHDKWVIDFNGLPCEWKLHVIDRNGALEQLEVKLAAELERQNRRISRYSEVCDFKQGIPVAVRFRDAVGLRDEGRGTEVLTFSAVNVWPKMRVFASDPGSLLKARDGTDAVARARYYFWYKFFVVADQIRVAVMFTFMAWLVAKFGFYLVQLFLMLPGKSGLARGKLRFVPWIRDSQGKFGMGELFRPYNLLVLVVAVGSSYLAVNLPDGAGLEAITHAVGAGSGISRVAHLVMVFAAIGFVLAGPLCLYPWKLGRWIDHFALNDLRTRYARAGEAERLEISKVESEILSQTTWPRGDNYFRFTILLVFAILLLPLGSAYEFLPSSVSQYCRTPQLIRAECKRFAARIYELDLSGNSAGTQAK